MELFIEKLRKLQTGVLDTIVKSNPNLGLDTRAEFFVKMFEKQLDPQSQILDIGGRWGFYVEPLEKRGHNVTVLDVVRPNYQNSPVVVYDGIKIPFEDKSFDTSLFITVLHHIDDLESVIKEAKRVTRKRIIIVEDLYHHRLGRWWTILRDRIYNFEWVGHPCRFKKADEWIATFKDLGFKLVDKQQVYTWLSGLRILNGVFVFERE